MTTTLILHSLFSNERACRAAIKDARFNDARKNLTVLTHIFKYTPSRIIKRRAAQLVSELGRDLAVRLYCPPTETMLQARPLAQAEAA